jgi:hypothetical protein
MGCAHLALTSLFLATMSDVFNTTALVHTAGESSMFVLLKIIFEPRSIAPLLPNTLPFTSVGQVVHEDGTTFQFSLSWRMNKSILVFAGRVRVCSGLETRPRWAFADAYAASPAHVAVTRSLVGSLRPGSDPQVSCRLIIIISGVIYSCAAYLPIFRVEHVR